MPTRTVRAVMLCAALSTAAAGNAANLLHDPGFEDGPGTAHWEPRTPTDADRILGIGDREARSGRLAAFIENRTDVLSRWRQGQQRSIAVEPGAELRYEGWIRTAAAANGGGAFLRLFLMSRDFRQVGVHRSQRLSGNADWRRAALYVTVPAGAAFAMAYIELQGKGLAFYDDLVLEVVAPPEHTGPGDILVVSDEPRDGMILQGVLQAVGNRLRRVVATADLADAGIAAGLRGLVVCRSSPQCPDFLLGALARLAETGVTVVTDLAPYAAMHGMDLRREAWAGVPRLDAVFPGPDGVYGVIAQCLDVHGWVGDLTLLVNGEEAGSWRLAADIPESEGHRKIAWEMAPRSLRRGDRVSLLACPAGGEDCAVESIAFQPHGGGAPVVLRAVDLEAANGYAPATGAAARPFESAMRARRSQVPTEAITITATTDVTRGFAIGDTIAWHGGPWRQSIGMAGGQPDTTVLARREDGTATMLERRIGRGRLVALDLAGPPEPHWGRRGGFHKYTFLANALGPGIRFGRHENRKLSHAEVVDRMAASADAARGIVLQDEGPGSAGHRIWSLTFGDPAKPMILLLAATHGSEWEPGYGLLALARSLAEDEGMRQQALRRHSLKIIPIHSPASYEAMRRHSPDGTDPNRNADYAWEEYTDSRTNKDGVYGPHAYAWKGASPFAIPETQTYKRIVEENPIAAVIEFHCAAWFVSLPATARADNLDRAADVRRRFADDLGRRVLFQPRHAAQVEAYRLGPLLRMGRTPFLLQVGARDRYGMLIELPGCTGTDTYAVLTVSELAATAAWAAIQTFTAE